MDNSIKLFTGSLPTVLILQAKLSDIGIPSRIKDDFQSGVIAGFGGGASTSVELFINESNLEKAIPIVEEFIKNEK